VYKLDSFVGFIGDEQLHAQKCYAGLCKVGGIFHNRALQRKIHLKKELARLAKVLLVDGNFYNFFGCN
jgi:hypothetical protein